MTEFLHGCERDADASDWCATHGAFLVADRPYCWATIRPNGDPLDVTGRDGYEAPLTKPVLHRARPTVDDRSMVVVWVVAGLAFVAAMVITILAVAGRPPNG